MVNMDSQLLGSGGKSTACGFQKAQIRLWKELIIELHLVDV